MAEASVVDASPVILLARSGFLSLLTALSSRVNLPLAVLSEVQEKGPEDSAVLAIQQASWLVQVSQPVAPKVSAWRLGAGESSVLSWALNHPGTVAVLDDARARRVAHSLKVPVVGTVGIGLLAKAKGQIPFVRPVLEDLIGQGMFISDRLHEEALKLAEE